jgi:hypothetical protein
MRAFNNKTVGWMTIAAGIATVSISVAIAVLVGISSLSYIAGLLGDLLGPVAVLLIMPVLISIGKIAMTKHGMLGRSVQIVGVLGALIDLIQGVLFLGRVIVYEQSVVWNTIARGLIGIAMLTYALLNRKNPGMKTAYVWLSIILGVIMASSFMSLPFQDVINAISEGNMSEANPSLLAYIFIAGPIFLLGWPIWLLWTGRLFLKGKLAVPESSELAPPKV